MPEYEAVIAFRVRVQETPGELFPGCLAGWAYADQMAAAIRAAGLSYGDVELVDAAPAVLLVPGESVNDLLVAASALRDIREVVWGRP